ncbi:MAG: hypothetical protein CSB15_00580 [Clostridiales bacterium]|nr:MAG: hypothetical protein CSB15_00580 [Clostridiales bacterium]
MVNILDDIKNFYSQVKPYVLGNSIITILIFITLIAFLLKNKNLVLSKFAIIFSILKIGQVFCELAYIYIMSEYDFFVKDSMPLFYLKIMFSAILLIISIYTYLKNKK